MKEKEISKLLDSLEDKIVEHKIITESFVKEFVLRAGPSKMANIKKRVKPVLDYMKKNFNLTKDEEDAITIKIYNYFIKKKTEYLYIDVELANIQMLSEILRNVGVPFTFRKSLLIGYLLDDYPSTEYIRNALQLLVNINSQGASLIISGPPGVGKTLLACHLLWLYLIIQDYKETETIRFYSYYNYDKNFLDKRFIVVDDVGMLSKDDIRDLIFKIYDNNLIAILTTDQTDIEFLTPFKDELRVLRRIKERFKWLFLSH